MKSKLYFGIFALLLVFLGTYLEHTSVPNQQIVIQFSDEQITVEDTENTIEVIQNKLQSIGISHIQIGQNEEGQLRITYYSASDVEDIQNALFEIEGFYLAYNSQQPHSDNFPEHNNHKDYEITVSEIKTGTDVHLDFAGTQVVEIKQKTDRFSYPTSNNNSHQINNLQTNSFVKVAVSDSNKVVLTIDNISYKIPEVRAGPST